MSDSQKVILSVLDKIGKPVNSTRLVKLIYFTDYLYFQFHGKTLTGFKYMWDHHGPNAVGNAILGETAKLSRKLTVHCTQYPNIHGNTTSLYRILPKKAVPSLSPEAEMIIEDVVRQYGKLNTNQITEASKRTEPFRTAKQYDLLHMKQIARVKRTTAEDYKRYKEQEERLGQVSLEEMRAMP